MIPNSSKSLDSGEGMTMAGSPCRRWKGSGAACTPQLSDAMRTKAHSKTVLFVIVRLLGIVTVSFPKRKISINYSASRAKNGKFRKYHITV